MNLLLILFFLHFVADYSWLSTSWMLSAKRFGTPIFPIIVHAGVHALLMGAALYFLGYSPLTVLKLTWIQLCTHTLIDIWKGRMNAWFPSLQNPANKTHWVVFGFDQYLHAVVIILMVHFAK